MINNPEFIIADEPTGNLDWEYTQEIWDVLVEANKMLNLEFYCKLQYLMTTKKKNNIDPEKEKLYIQIANHCDWLRIARYLKNEAKNALKYFHAHKLSNIKKNLKFSMDIMIY